MRNSKKVMGQAVSLLIAIIMILPVVPLDYISAEDIKPLEKPDYSEEVYVIAEDTTKRGEFEKHFVLSDGSLVAVVYPESVHAIDYQGQWSDINNRLTISDEGYKNGNSSVILPELYGNDSFVSLNNDGLLFEWQFNACGVDGSFLEKNNSVGIIVENEQKGDYLFRVSDPDAFSLPDLSSTVIYESIFDSCSDITARYTVSANKVEEDIIIDKQVPVSSFILSIKKNGMTAEVNENRSVTFYSEESEKFTIGVPYVVDAALDALTEINVDVEESGNTINVIYTPDSEWMLSEERVYPLVFDPSITTSEYRSNIVDTYVKEDSTADYSSSQLLYFGVYSSKVCRAYFKIGNLPTIDPSLPIISASMFLSLWTGTSTGKQVKLCKVNGNWSPSTITFANQPGATVLSNCAFNPNNLHYTFDLSTQLINEFYTGEGYGYQLRYSDESLANPDFNTVYSVESVTPSYRPVISIIYGYPLPSELQNGHIYSLQNWESLSILTVHDGVDSNGTNVYQYSTNFQNITAKQQFKLEYVSGTGGYLFRAMCSSNGTNRVLDIVKNGDYVESGCNVQLHANTDPRAEEWLIIGAGILTFRIVPRSNMALALTVHPSSSNGTASGTGTDSPGNVFVSTFSEDNEYQYWAIIENGNWICSDYYSLENGFYYINNKDTGKYLYKDPSEEPAGSSGLMSVLGNDIRWKITEAGDDKYTIQPASDMTLFLAKNGNDVELNRIGSTGQIPNKCKWSIEPSLGEGYTISNTENNVVFYLGSQNTSLLLITDRGDPGSEAYDKTTWRIADEEIAHYRELNSSFSISDMIIDIGESRAPVINKSPSNALWASSSDFEFSVPSNSFITFSSGKINGIKRGVIEVTATHKVTNLSKSFEVFVKNSLLSDDEKDDLYDEFDNLLGDGYAYLV